ncbi:hypothetical protein N7462_003944 [Penicillium macrosclerotiorum]|uniref:uncharacterized protein n=1 Tax=Penicillium macrosclerotiorum TaxID=303699 RepID=UPI0025471EE8|nr:uncharacterized protein N7462_003944 [Penicillium macrosclerotiorum]KAJ5689552.1 hypothetical protein N7462_003944 [Penicillium macrosclerotiorum]
MGFWRSQSGQGLTLLPESGELLTIPHTAPETGRSTQQTGTEPDSHEWLGFVPVFPIHRELGAAERRLAAEWTH